jgi:DnaJ-class molecular chaperone
MHERSIAQTLSSASYKLCPVCNGQGEGRSWWSIGAPKLGECGTCSGSGLIPLRGYYEIREPFPAISIIKTGAK